MERNENDDRLREQNAEQLYKKIKYIKDKYDVSNLVFSISITANIMQSESNIEYAINKLNNNSSLKNISREQKKINDLTWEYITLDNYYDNNNSYKNHSYYYETYDGKYYTTYIIQFNKVDNMEEFEKMQAKLKLLGELSKGESSAKENGYIDESEVEKLLGVNNG